MQRTLAGAALALLLALPTAHAETFRWAGQTDPSSLDPHAAAVGTNLSFLGNIYEGLVRRGKDMSMQPGLAVAWEPLGADGWRFTLRQGVKFHGGEDFDAEDVLFSYQRATGEGSDVSAWFASVSEVKVVDSHTIEFLTKRPNPLFPNEIPNWLIMDKGWAEANGAANASKETENFATSNTNGTGPFKVSLREADIRTVLVPHDGWWETPEHNVTEAIYTPIDNSATRLAALLSGEVDFVEPIPLQNVPRVKATDGINVLEGAETRVIMVGFAHEADALRYGNGAAKNPLQDVRVRQAIYHAIDIDAIVAKVMRGQAQPAGLLISPGANGFKDELNTRLPYNPDGAKALLAEAGYADGFTMGFRCPNDRYINDEAICQAIVGMLAQVGVTANLETITVSKYWPQLRADEFDMYLLGWSPGGVLDASHPMRFLLSTPNKEAKLGSWNFGGYSNARIDELYPQITSELDPTKRQEMIDEVHRVMKDEVAYVPLHVQPLVWAVRDNVALTQRPDNFFNLYWVSVN